MSIFLGIFVSFRFSIFLDDFVCVLAGIVQLVCWPDRVRLSFSFNSLNCTSGLVLLCFLIRLTDFCFVLPGLLGIDFFNDLPHKIITSELTYGTLNFMNIYLLNVNSVHLSSAKHICLNS